jgi:hypothetical protein
MRRLVIVVILVSAGACAHAGGQAVHAPPSSIVSRWQIRSIDTPVSTIQFNEQHQVLLVGLEGNKLTCSFPGGAPLACEFSKNTLKFRFDEDHGRGNAVLHYDYSGTLQPDGTLEGSVTICSADNNPVYPCRTSFLWKATRGTPGPE